MTAAIRSERMISRYVLTLDFKRGREIYRNAPRYLQADSDDEARKQARALIVQERDERRGGWTPIESSARLVSEVIITEEVVL